MAEHAEVFIFATTCDLGSYRRVVKDALLTKDIFPIEETDFALAYGPLTEMLQAASCHSRFALGHAEDECTFKGSCPCTILTRHRFDERP